MKTERELSCVGTASIFSGGSAYLSCEYVVKGNSIIYNMVQLRLGWYSMVNTHVLMCATQLVYNRIPYLQDMTDLFFKINIQNLGLPNI